MGNARTGCKTISTRPLLKPATTALDSPRFLPAVSPANLLNPMGQQLNKHIKKKRRVAYHKRKKAAAAAVAKKPASKAKK